MDFEKSNIDVTVFDEGQNENNPRKSDVFFCDY